MEKEPSPRQKWIDREFDTGQPPEVLPGLVERLRAAPDRIAKIVANTDPATLTSNEPENWSIQENIGHLADLEPLWHGRLDDFAAGATELRPADMSNRKTHQANHNERSILDLLREFQIARNHLVERFTSLEGASATRVARHPRLGTPMTPIDMAAFIADHDDHHIDTILELLQKAEERRART